MKARIGVISFFFSFWIIGLTDIDKYTKSLFIVLLDCDEWWPDVHARIRTYQNIIYKHIITILLLMNCS